jgi:hypothetical protein
MQQQAQRCGNNSTTFVSSSTNSKNAWTRAMNKIKIKSKNSYLLTAHVLEHEMVLRPWFRITSETMDF